MATRENDIEVRTTMKCKTALKNPEWKFFNPHFDKERHQKEETVYEFIWVIKRR